MKAPASLQRRLILGLTLGVTALWLVASILTGRVVQRELDEAFDSALQETAQRLLPLAILDIFNREEALGPQRVAPLNAPLNAQQEHFSYLVRDAGGKVLLQSRTSAPALFDENTPQQGFSTSATHRLYSTSALRNTIFIDIAEPLAYREEATHDAIIALLQPLLLLIPLSLLGSWLLVRVSLRSVLSYRDAIEQRGAGDLSPIAAGQLPAEISPLAEAVNHLMERLRSALDAERSFTANSAHELRTPLAATLAQIQRLRREAPAALQARIAQIEASLRDLARLSEKLMQLAKAEGGGLLSETPQDLTALLELVVQDARRAAEVPITLLLPEDGTHRPNGSNRSNGSIWSTIDPDAFAILLRNLIENALKHGPPEQAIAVSLMHSNSNTALLKIVNAGQIVPAPLLAQLTGRFIRGASLANGSGLGLAIANTIASGVGAQLTLASPATGRDDGFEACVRFSVASVSRVKAS
jgi:two-component system OmpR family sensor kinase